MTLREADAIIKAQAEAGVTVQVGVMRRYAPAFLEACRLVRELESVRLARVHDVLGRNDLIISNTSPVVRGTDVPAAVTQRGAAQRAALLEEAVGAASPEIQRAYGLLLGLSSHDVSAMRELLGAPEGVLYASQRSGGDYVTAAFDYGDYVCQFETGVDDIPRFDAHLEVYGRDRVIRVQYDTPYVLNLPIRVSTVEANRKGGVVERREHPVWGDAFVAQWESFHGHVTEGTTPKSSPQDFREDLKIFAQMIALMQSRG
jgi:predicted dehydrogenase